MVKASKSEKTSAPSEESRLRQGSGGQGLEETFSDIAALAEGCRFSDCRHESEPGCAVRQAIEEGLLAPERLESARALEKEVRYLELRQDAAARKEANKKLAGLYKWHKQVKHKRRL